MRRKLVVPQAFMESLSGENQAEPGTTVIAPDGVQIPVFSEIGLDRKLDFN